MTLTFAVLILFSNVSHAVSCRAIADRIFVVFQKESQTTIRSPIEALIQQGNANHLFTSGQIAILKEIPAAQVQILQPGSIAERVPQILHLVDAYRLLAKPNPNFKTPQAAYMHFDFVRRLELQWVETLGDYLPIHQQHLKQEFIRVFNQFEKSEEHLREAFALSKKDEFRKVMHNDLVAGISGICAELQAALEIPNVRALNIRLSELSQTMNRSKELEGIQKITEEAWAEAAKLSREDFLHLIRIHAPDLAELRESMEPDMKRMIYGFRTFIAQREFDLLTIVNGTPTLVEVKSRKRPIRTQDLILSRDPEAKGLGQINGRLSYKIDARNLFAALLRKKPEEVFALGFYAPRGLTRDAKLWLEASGVRVIEPRVDKSLTISD